MLFGHTFGSYSPAVRSPFSMLCVTSRRSFRRDSFAALHITNILTSYHHTRHVHACHIIAGITVTASFPSSRLSLYSLADNDFDSFESFVYLLHRMHSFLGLCIDITTLGFGFVFMRCYNGCKTQKRSRVFLSAKQAGKALLGGFNIEITGIDERAGRAPMHT